MRVYLAAVLTAGLALSLTASANAAQVVVHTDARGAIKSTVVNLSDLDLSKPAGRQAAYARIRFAARRVCGSPDQRLDLEREVRLDACLRNTAHRAERLVQAHLLRAQLAQR